MERIYQRCIKNILFAVVSVLTIISPSTQAYLDCHDLNSTEGELACVKINIETIDKKTQSLSQSIKKLLNEQQKSHFILAQQAWRAFKDYDCQLNTSLESKIKKISSDLDKELYEKHCLFTVSQDRFQVLSQLLNRKLEKLQLKDSNQAQGFNTINKMEHLIASIKISKVMTINLE